MTLESRRKEARWGSIALGWLVAVLAGVLVSPLLRALFGLRAEPPGVRGEFTAAEPASWSRASNQIRQAGTLRPGLPATLGAQRGHDGRFRDDLRDDADCPRGDLCYGGSPPPGDLWLRCGRRNSQSGSLPRQPVRWLRRRDTRKIVCPEVKPRGFARRLGPRRPRGTTLRRNERSAGGARFRDLGDRRDHGVRTHPAGGEPRRGQTVRFGRR